MGRRPNSGGDDERTAKRNPLRAEWSGSHEPLHQADVTCDSAPGFVVGPSPNTESTEVEHPRRRATDN